jgi:hypothetical protein
LIGLGLSGWASDAGTQPDLFAQTAPQPRSQDEQLYQTLDAIRQRFGAGSIGRGLVREKDTDSE